MRVAVTRLLPLNKVEEKVSHRGLSRGTKNEVLDTFDDASLRDAGKLETAGWLGIEPLVSRPYMLANLVAMILLAVAIVVRLYG
jgi:hypothetical protein